MSGRKSHWENIYRRKLTNEVSWYQENPEISLSLIKKTGVNKTEPIIDVGGGTSLLVDFLMDAGFSDISVLDISSYALKKTRERLGSKAHLVKWYEADVTQFEATHTYSVWHDRAVFHFLTAPDDRSRYIEKVWGCLSPGGHLIIAAFAIGGPKQCSGLDVEQYDADKMLGELGDGFVLLEEQHERHVTPEKKEQMFAYFHLQRE